MGIDKETGKDVWEAKRKVYKGTSISSTRLRQKMRMKVNVLDNKMGGVLSIKCEDEK